MNISLTPALESYIQNKLNSGLYTSASEIVRESLRLLHQHEQAPALTTTHNNKQSFIDELKGMVVDFFKDKPVKVYLFGSRARKDARPTSDVDIAVEAIKKIDSSLLSQLKDILEESHIPYRVDVVDFNSANKTMQKSIKNEGVLWKDYSKE